MESIDIEKMSVSELKATAYDIIKQQTVNQQNLSTLNQRIAGLEVNPKEEDGTAQPTVTEPTQLEA